MSVSLFYNPDLVDQLAACGITARRQRPPGAPTSGFVLRTSAPRARGGGATHVVSNLGNVIVTASRQLATSEIRALPAASTAPIAPQTALELAEECTRLRRDNQRLSDEVTRLRAEVDRLTMPRQSTGTELDDSARRFALLELDL